MRTVIYGSRPDGHAKVVAQLAEAQAALELVGLIDDFPENRERVVEGLRVVGTVNDLERLRSSGVEALLMGFGESIGRTRIVERAVAAGLELPDLIHETSVLSSSAVIGRGVQVFSFAHIGANARLGDGVLVNTGAVVEHDVRLESGVVVLPNATLAGRIRVGTDATIGAGATVLPDITIGTGALVGAGAVVVKPVPPGERVAGVPARPL
jgi:UDP-perosamine 4-acetyltransferase